MIEAILYKEISGAPVTVKIRGTERPLLYTLNAVILYKQRTGDSLFDKDAYLKIDLQKDPGRWLICLWAGLHRPPDKPGDGWREEVTLDELAALIDFSNAAEISLQMSKALVQSMPKAPEGAKSPKDAAPGEPAPSPSSASPSSTPELAGASA
jgi:hypothetical protein